MKNDLVTFLSFPQNSDARGKIIFAECGHQVPFDIKRIYYVLDGSPEHPRGGHAHRKTKSVLIPIAGETKLVIDNGRARQEITLSNPSEGLFVDAMVFIENIRVDPKAACLVLASTPYDEADYIRSYTEFLKSI